MASPGDKVPDRYNPGYTWLIVAIDEQDVVHVELLRPDGIAADAFVRWPLSRWHRFLNERDAEREPAGV